MQILKKVWRAAFIRSLKWLSSTPKFLILMLWYSKPLCIINLFPIYFSSEPKWYPHEREILCFSMVFVNLGGPKYGFRQVFGLFGDSTWTTVHKNSTFDCTEIAAISLIFVRFWWSFFCFPCDSQGYQNLDRNHTSERYEFPPCTPYWLGYHGRGLILLKFG